MIWLKKLVLRLGPITLLVVVLAASFRMVQSGTLREDTNNLSAPATPSVVVASKSAARAEDLSKLPDGTQQSPPQVQPQSLGKGRTGLESKKEDVWLEINDAISGLNELVGAEMFVDVKRGDKGQMEILLDNEYWKRVRYQTRVDLKTDISNLWHLYATEYDQAESSVVYFIDETDGRVIDIFSRAK